MKKIMWFWLIPSFLLVVILIFSITLPMHSKITYEREIDNKAYEQKIKFALQYENEDTDSVNRLHVLFRDGKLTQKVDYFVNEETSKKTNLNFENNIRTIYKEQSNSSVSDEDCKMIQKQLEQAPISYRLSFYGNNDDYYREIYDKDNKIVTLNTDLKYESGNDVELVQSSTTCGDMIVDEFIERKLLNDTGHVDQLAVSHLYKGYYYFMPISDQSMSGQNSIYRIKITENNKNRKSFYEEEIDPLVNLTKSRYYSEMMQHEERLYVVSYDNEKTYITQYTIEGKVLNEVEIKSDGGITNPNMIISNGHLILQAYQQNKECYSIFNMNTLAFVKNIDFSPYYDDNRFTMYPLDMKFEEGVLYLLYAEKDAQDEYDGDIFTGDIVVCVADQDNLLYKGMMKSIMNEKLENHKIRLSGHFMEVK